MLLEVIKEIRMTETEADRLKNKAKDESRQILADANAKAAGIIEKSIKDAEAKALKTMEKAEAEAKIEIEEINQKVSKESAELKNAVSAKATKAVDYIIRRTINRNDR